MKSIAWYAVVMVNTHFTLLMIYCQLIDRTGNMGIECYPVAPAKGDYVLFDNQHYLVLDRVVTPVTDTRHVILFLLQQEPKNQALDEWRGTSTT